MTTIAISTLEADPRGALLLRTNRGRTQLGEWARRATRTATLDGGAVVVDAGFSHADRTVLVDLSDQSQEIIEDAQWIVEAYGSVILMLPDGAYRATPQRVVVTGNVATMTLLISGDAELRA